MTISLCIIAGNESAHIERMLSSFSASFDELSLVRATGTTAPDNTEQTARLWCQLNGKPMVFSEYANRTAGRDFPHVDNFAAARNQSFAQATGDWLMWADCDDVIDDASALRATIESTPNNVLLLRFPYAIPTAGKTTQRERVIRRASFEAGRRWHWAVHENLLAFYGDPITNHAAPVWKHDPIGVKSGGDRRNLRILTGALADAPTNYYYCHQENFHLSKPTEARRFGELFLSLPGGNPAMRYQCHLNLCEIAELKTDAAAHALQAHYLYPRQKEAIAALVKCAFQDESSERALHWSRLLIETESPPLGERLWCYEPKWDGWAALDLRARALRYAGKTAETEAAEYQLHGYFPPKFSLLHATRGRTEQAVRCRDRWLDAAADPAAVEHIFAIDADDAESNRWLRSFKHVVSPESTCVAAWNLAAQHSHGAVLIQLSDDWTPPREWDRLLTDVISKRHIFQSEFVVAVSDGHRTDALLCMAILSRARYEAQGHLFHPEYEGVFSDNEFTVRAKDDGIILNARHLTFHHHHPAFGDAPMDATYRRQNDPRKYRRGMEIFNRRNPHHAIKQNSSAS